MRNYLLVTQEDIRGGPLGRGTGNEWIQAGLNERATDLAHTTYEE